MGCVAYRTFSRRVARLSIRLGLPVVLSLFVVPAAPAAAADASVEFVAAEDGEGRAGPVVPSAGEAVLLVDCAAEPSGFAVCFSFGESLVAYLDVW